MSVIPLPRLALALGAALLTACGPHAHIPPRPATVPDALATDDSDAVLARSLAPILYRQIDETFPLSRAVAVVHPTRRIIAYHLLWRDDVQGAWIPFTKPTDEEEVWIGYDSSGAPSDMWTYWHGDILHTSWRGKGTPAIDVQWGKHGSLPRGIIESDLPAPRTLNFFYAMTWVLLPDIWLGDLVRKGPLCFCHGYTRYRTYGRPITLAEHLDAVVETTHPQSALSAIFGTPYSNKALWPPGLDSVGPKRLRSAPIAPSR